MASRREGGLWLAGWRLILSGNNGKIKADEMHLVIFKFKIIFFLLFYLEHICIEGVFFLKKKKNHFVL